MNRQRYDGSFKNRPVSAFLQPDGRPCFIRFNIHADHTGFERITVQVVPLRGAGSSLSAHCTPISRVYENAVDLLLSKVDRAGEPELRATLINAYPAWLRYYKIEMKLMQGTGFYVDGQLRNIYPGDAR